MMNEAQSKYDLDVSFDLSGYQISDWIDDILLKVRNLIAKRKLKELIKIEERLNKLMSSEKKELIELIKLSKLLGL